MDVAADTGGDPPGPLPSAAGQTGIYPETGRTQATAGHPDSARQSDPGRHGADPEPDI